MVAPRLLALATPLVAGSVLGAGAVGGLLMGSTMSGLILAILMNTGGAAWDNAKERMSTTTP